MKVSGPQRTVECGTADAACQQLSAGHDTVLLAGQVANHGAKASVSGGDPPW
jgi:hypothetical protein